jgi:hypothetical protein
MSVLDQILGRRPVQEDEPPVQAARTPVPSAQRKEKPKDEESDTLKKKARRSAVVASILGMTESDDESIIPDDAKPVDTFSGVHEIPGMGEVPKFGATGPAEPATVHGEELIPPTAALVAPDVTPDVLKAIDPSQVPAPPAAPMPPGGAPTGAPAQPQHALDTILGRQNTAPQPGPPIHAPVTAESFAHMINPIEVKSKVAEALIPSTEGGSEMPNHKEGDGKAIYSAFRRFVG